LQVELAQYKYLLPRLSGMGLSLSRQGGGIGTRGPGETKLESDRRHIRERINRLETELEQVRKVRGVQRQNRMKNSVPVVAIVGYTNAGKSTLLNQLTGAGIPANNRLFDTLDTTSRQLTVSENLDVIVDFVLHDLHSGATINEIIGAYDNTPRREMITIVDKQEYRRLMDFVRTTDPKAFVTVYSVSEMRYTPKK